jgi:predicted phosphodiesterase
MAMKIGIMSDLHMYKTVKTEETPWDFVPEADVFYICAGDICEDNDARTRFNQKHYDHMLAINGNHDYYGNTFSDAKYHTILREVNGVRIAGATLWTDVRDNLAWYTYKKGLIDSYYISDLTHEAMIECHEMHKHFLFGMDADIIVSHHAPTMRSVHERYMNDPHNVCFANDLEKQIFNMKKPPKLWIHGHTHDDFDYMIGDTRVICHPRGYKNERDDYWRYAPKIVEI